MRLGNSHLGPLLTSASRTPFLDLHFCRQPQASMLVPHQADRCLSSDGPWCSRMRQGPFRARCGPAAHLRFTKKPSENNELSAASCAVSFLEQPPWTCNFSMGLCCSSTKKRLQTLPQMFGAFFRARLLTPPVEVISNGRLAEHGLRIRSPATSTDRGHGGLAS